MTFIITLFFIDVKVSKQLYSDFSGLPTGKELDDFIGYFYFSLLINIYACYTLPLDVEEEVETITEEDNSLQIGKASCSNCGAEMLVNDELIETCCYFGTHNYNNAYINLVRYQQNNLAYYSLKIKTDFLARYSKSFSLFAFVYTIIGILPITTIFLPILIRIFL